MDKKERQLAAGLVARLCSGDFGESDVLALLIVLRRHAQGTAPFVAELGDFVAHREKDRGLLLKFLQAVQASITGTGPKRDEFEVPGSAVALHQELERLLPALDLPTMPLETVECLVVLASSLLQSVAFDAAVEQPWQEWRLEFGFTRDVVGLYGVVPLPKSSMLFPVLLARNRFFSSPYEGGEACWTPDRSFFVTTWCRGGIVFFDQQPTTPRR